MLEADMKICRACSLGGVIKEHTCETIREQGEEIKVILYVLIVIFTFSIISEVIFYYRTFRKYRKQRKKLKRTHYHC